MQLKFENPHFVQGKLYRLEIVRRFAPQFPLNFLKVDFYELEDDCTKEHLKNLSINDLTKYFEVERDNLYKNSKTVEVDAGSLFLLKPGTIWEAQDENTISRTFCPSEKSRITINTGFSADKKFKDLEVEADFKYPKSVSLIRFQKAKVYDEEVTVLIPHTEVARHYYAHSTYFISRVFSEDGIRETAELCESSDDETNHCRVKLNSRHYLNSDIPHIARILMNDTALNAVNEIYSYAYNYYKYYKNNDYLLYDLPLKTHLPFTGEAELDVIGHYLSNANNQKIFLVRQIQVCHKKLPFDSLSYISAENYLQRDRDEYKIQRRSEQQDLGEDDVAVLVGINPNNNQNELRVALNQDVRFAQLDEVDVDKEFLVKDDGNNIGYLSVTDQLETAIKQGAIALGNYVRNNPVHPIVFDVNNGNDRTIKSLEEVSEIFAELNDKHESWQINAMPIGFVDESTPYGYFEFVNSKWSQLNGCRRKGIFLRVSTPNNTMYFLDIEPTVKNNQIKRYSIHCCSTARRYIDNECVKDLLREISLDSGKLIKTKLERCFGSVSRLKHTDNDGSLKKRIEKMIIEFA